MENEVVHELWFTLTCSARFKNIFALSFYYLLASKENSLVYDCISASFSFHSLFVAYIVATYYYIIILFFHENK